MQARAIQTSPPPARAEARSRADLRISALGSGSDYSAFLQHAGVPYDVVPGVTSAVAAPAAAGIPVTMRNQASAFTVVTGHVDPTGTSTVDWEAHAATGATLVILMGVGQIASIAKRLIAAGRSPDTPVAVVHAATTSEQQVVRLTLAEVGHAELVAPSTIIVGDVAALDLR